MIQLVGWTDGIECGDASADIAIKNRLSAGQPHNQITTRDGSKEPAEEMISIRLW